MKLASYLGYRSIGVLVDNNRIHLVTGACVSPPPE